MLTMTKRGADLSKTNGFSLRNLFSIAKEKVKSIIKEMYETQKEFDEELKRVDWMEEKLNQIAQMKIEMKRTIKTVSKKENSTKKEEEIPSKKVIYNERVDMSRYLRKEGASRAVESVNKLLEKSANHELSIQKIQGRISLLPKDYVSKIQKQQEKNEEVPKKEESVQIRAEVLKKTKNVDGQPSKPLGVFDYIKEIEKIDTYICENKESKDFEKLYRIRQFMDVRSEYIAKMKSPIMLSMAQFNAELRIFINNVKSGDFHYEEDDILMMNRNYCFLKNLYTKYVTEEDVKEILMSIEVKVNWIHKKIEEKKTQQSVFVKEKVA